MEIAFCPKQPPCMRYIKYIITMCRKHQPRRVVIVITTEYMTSPYSLKPTVKQVQSLWETYFAFLPPCLDDTGFYSTFKRDRPVDYIVAEKGVALAAQVDEWFTLETAE